MSLRARWMAAAVAVLATSQAAAFEIQTGVSEPCHERITLGAFGLAPPPFGPPDEDNLVASFEFLIDRARPIGVPQDKATQLFIEDIAEEFDLSRFSTYQRWLLASFVAGARDPDTRGVSLAAINSARETHIDPERQALHSLRRPEDDGPEGDAAAIMHARAAIVAAVERAHATWTTDSVEEARWTLPFRGGVDVTVFTAAFEFGRAAHTVQDAYTHMLRDDKGRIVTVLNYADALLDGHDEARDGIRHSDRMDTCEVETDPFDAERVGWARDATIAMLRAGIATLSRDRFDPKMLNDELDQIYRLKGGCTVGNDYCQNPWLDEARKTPTEPVHLWFCAASPSGGPPWWIWLLVGGFGVVQRFRRSPGPGPGRERRR